MFLWTLSRNCRSRNRQLLCMPGHRRMRAVASSDPRLGPGLRRLRCGGVAPGRDMAAANLARSGAWHLFALPASSSSLGCTRQTSVALWSARGAQLRQSQRRHSRAHGAGRWRGQRRHGRVGPERGGVRPRPGIPVAGRALMGSCCMHTIGGWTRRSKNRHAGADRHTHAACALVAESSAGQAAHFRRSGFRAI